MLLSDFAILQEVTVQKAPKYTKWTDEDQYAIVKNAFEHGNAAAVRHFKNDFPNIKESTVREFKKRYEKQLQEAKKQNLQPKLAKKFSSKTGRPLFLGKFDLMLQSYIKGMSNRGAVITWSVANAAGCYW